MCSRTIWQVMCVVVMFLFFFFNDTATTEIYTLSLHDALPISLERRKCLRREKRYRLEEEEEERASLPEAPWRA